MAEAPAAGFVEMLLPKAISFCEENDEKISFLYRNKPAEYFVKNEKVMRPEEQALVGHPQSPIQGQLDGIFFSVTLFQGNLPTFSPFGDKRICIAIEALFKEDSNLYFADFYCYKPRGSSRVTHHVLLVLTKTGTTADEFCRENLPRLDPNQNRFLWRNKGKYYTRKQIGLWVDVFYTESVDIDSLKKTYGEENVYFKSGFGKVKEGTYNMKIDKYCTICNLSREEQERLRRGSRRGEGSREEGSSEEGEEGSSEEGEEGSSEEDSRKEGSREEELRGEHQGDEVDILAKGLERM